MPLRFARFPLRAGILVLAMIMAAPIAAQDRARAPAASNPPATAPSSSKRDDRGARVQANADKAAVDAALAALRDATDTAAADAARARLATLADRGSLLAAYHAGQIAASGQYGPVDAASAERYLRKAAEAGHADAQYALAVLLLAVSDSPDRAQRDEALTWLRRSAKSLPESVYLLALVSARASADPKAAEAEVVRKAAQAGYAPAQYRMAADLLLQPPQPERDRVAVDLLQKAADQGHLAANLDLGVLLLEGTRVARDVARALPLLERAAGAGEPRAEYALGRAYTTGEGPESDSAKGIALIQRAAAKRLPAAEYAMGFAHTQGIGVGVDDVKAFAWFQRSAAQGYADAMFAVGNAYANGYGVGKSPTKADEWHCKAAQAGHRAAIERMRLAGPEVCKLSSTDTAR